MTWNSFIYQNVVDFCNNKGSRTFSFREFWDDRKDALIAFRAGNHHVEDKIRQVLQFLRDDNLISFEERRGYYTLRGVDLLKDEKEETETISFISEDPGKREYLIETYIRKAFWARTALDILGDSCIVSDCHNTFLREDGSRYVEVHHIIPLCEGGVDGIWNLSVLCAHHHKMAHFADSKTKLEFKDYLLNENEKRTRKLTPITPDAGF